MTPEEYAAKQALIAAAVAAFAYQIAKFWSQVVISPLEWVSLLRFMWPEVQYRRRESAALARRFYDAQRGVYHPQLPVFERPLESSDFDVFVKNMEPVRVKMSAKDSTPDAVTKMALRVVQEVENAGRRQIIRAVREDEAVAAAVANEIPKGRRTIPFTDSELAELRRIAGTDPQTRRTWGAEVEEPMNLRNTKKQIREASRSGLVRGWARVATGRETCAWCIMLISRGPVYYEAATAGLKGLDDATAIEMFRENDLETYGRDTREYMDDWHTGCDCKVIPVFKADDWENSPFGKAAKRALDFWNDASEAAERELDKRGTRTHTVGKKKGRNMTFNEEAILALRRRLYAGDINPAEFAGLAA